MYARSLGALGPLSRSSWLWGVCPCTPRSVLVAQTLLLQLDVKGSRSITADDLQRGLEQSARAALTEPRRPGALTWV